MTDQALMKASLKANCINGGVILPVIQSSCLLPDYTLQTCPSKVVKLRSRSKSELVTVTRLNELTNHLKLNLRFD